MAFDWGTTPDTGTSAAPGTGPSFDWGGAGKPAAPSFNAGTPKNLELTGFGGKAIAPSIAPPKPADTSSLFSKSLSFVKNASNKISDAIAPPVGNLGGASDVSKPPSAMDFLPSELARQIPGVADLQDDPELSQYIDADTVGKAVPQAVVDTAKSLVKMPIVFGADVWDAIQTNIFGRNPSASFTVPGLGKISSNQFNVAQRIQAGEDPVSAALSEGGSAIFNTLFFADVVNRVSGPRQVKVAETKGNLNDLPKANPDDYRAPINPAPKTGRLYEAPTTYNKGGAQVLPPDMLSAMKDQGISLGKKFDPAQPVFFKVTAGKGGAYTGEIIQIKPSYLETAYNKLFGDRVAQSTEPTIPRLLGAPEQTGVSTANPTDLGPLADKAKPQDITTLHSSTVFTSDIVQAVKDASNKEQPKENQPPVLQLPPPASKVVAHNTLRLLGGDTAKAGEVSDLILKEAKESIATHGEDVTYHALIEKFGMGPEQAAELIKEAKVPSTPEEIKAQAAKLFEGRTDEEITAHAQTFVDTNVEKLTDTYIEKFGNQVGTDEAKELIPGYEHDRSTSDLVQKAANKIAESAFTKLLDTRQDEGNNVVLITAGGTGAGKSTALRSGGINPKDYSVVFDTNLSNGGSAIARINKALEKGYDVSIQFVYAPVQESYSRALGRTDEQARKLGSGRPVSAQGHIDMHHGSYDGLLAVLKEFKGNERVRIYVKDNTGKKLIEVHDILDFIQKISDNKEDETKLHAELNQIRKSSGVSEGTQRAYERAEKLRPQKVKPAVPQVAREGSEGTPADVLEQKKDSVAGNSQAGFINVEAMAEQTAAAVKKVQDAIREIENIHQLSGTVSELGYQHQNKRTANRQRLITIAQDVGNLLDAQGWQNLYHYDENSKEPLTPEEKEIYDNVIAPLKDSLAESIRQYRELGGDVTQELFFMENEGYTPRFAKDKGSAIDKLIDSGKKVKKSISNGGLFSQSLGTVSKSRTFYTATDENGKRTVVHIPTDKSENVTGFRNGEPVDLGQVKGSRTPKVKEFFDPAVRGELEKLAKEIGVKHVRVATGKSKGLGKDTAGVSFQGENLIKTRLSQDSVLAHELGHQIDYKYGMQDIFKEGTYDAQRKRDLQAEMRALADKRFEGKEVTESFKKYVRKGSEKMAVMFEAYLSNKEMFAEVAPHLYDDFRDFLSSHSELKPFLDIEGGIGLGSQTHGNVQTGKIGKTFVDNKGKKYTIGQATTKEIEANTKVRYHTNALANYLVALDRATNALNAVRLLERIKDESEFGDIIRKDNPDEAPPEGWKSVGDKLPQFRGYHVEPRTSEVLTDLANRQKGQVSIPVFDEINNLLISAIVLNPVMHVPNVLAGRALAGATGGIPTKTIANLRTAIDEVKNKGPLYLSYLEHGAPFMHLKETTKNFSDAILTQYTEEVEQEPTRNEELARLLGFTTAKEWGHNLNKLNEDITWGSNDIFFMHAMLDYQDTHGGSIQDAIREVSKRMADYRIPERILLPGQAGRVLSIAAQSRAFMFGRFHYSGVIKPWIEAAKEGAKGDVKSARAFAYLFLMGLLVYPFMNKLWQGVTGSPASYMSMAGPVKPVQVGEKLGAQGVAGIPTALQSVFSLSPAARAMIELGFNVDLFQRNPIYGQPPAEGMSAYTSSIISPLASASRMTPGDFALSLFGVWTPKNVPAKTTLNTMKYDELPAVQVAVKKAIVSGHQDQADALMKEFNSRSIATWNQYQLQSNGTQLVTTDEEKQAFLKEWGIKAPGEKALTNAATAYADGSLTSKSSLTDTVATYAKAIGVSPATAFERMFTGQRILRVQNFGLFSNDASIIVERMPESDSQAVKTARGASKDQVLDHVIPLEAGGSNDKENLNLIPAENNVGEQHIFENLLGSAVKSGTISQAKVKEYSIRYKVGQGETLPDAYMADFTNKYGGKTMSLQDVQDAISKGQAK